MFPQNFHTKKLDGINAFYTMTGSFVYPNHLTVLMHNVQNRKTVRHALKILQQKMQKNMSEHFETLGIKGLTQSCFIFLNLSFL